MSAPVEMVRTRGTCWGIAVMPPDGRCWLSYGNQSPHSLFCKRADAVAHAVELKKHLQEKTRVRVVRVAYRLRGFRCKGAADASLNYAWSE